MTASMYTELFQPCEADGGGVMQLCRRICDTQDDIVHTVERHLVVVSAFLLLLMNLSLYRPVCTFEFERLR